MPQTIQQLLQTSRIDSLDTELLLAHVLNQPREFVIAHPTYKVGFLKTWQYRNLLKKRQQGIPLAYITGAKDFYGLNFLVSKQVLIPRPETEILVSEVLNTLKDDDVLIDVGTGSGCIPIAINKHRQVKTYAIDKSWLALLVAEENARNHNLNINFLRGNLLRPLPKVKNHLIITANLPYLTEKQFHNEPAIQSEPKSALVAKNDGLQLYEELIKQISKLENKVTAFFEIDPGQSEKMKKIIRQYLPDSKIEIKKDLANLDRLVIIHK